MKLYCVECKKVIDTIQKTGKEIYPHREDLYKKIFYECPICKNYVGCHKDTNRPLGCIPNKELKNARQHIHTKLDGLWKSKLIGRTEIYKRLSRSLGYTYHTGNTKTIEECREIYRILIKIENELTSSSHLPL